MTEVRPLMSQFVMPETVSAGESQPADDLRSTLAAALAESEQPDVVAKAEPKAAPVADVGTEAEPSEAAPEEKADTRARGPDGKFAKKEGEPEAEAAAEPEAAAVEPEKKPEGLEPPSNWSQKDKEFFKAQAPEAQKFLIDRAKNMENDYYRKTEAVAALKRDWEPVAKIFEPYSEVMKQKGFTPRSLIESWANVEKRLTENPVEVITGLVRGYRVNPGQLAAALGIKAAPLAEGEAPPAVEQQPTVQLPPELIAEINQLRQQVGGLTQAQQQQQQAAVAAREARVANDIDQFKSAKDDKGNLLHPHFDEIEEHMTHLALAAKAAGQAIPNLPDLYERAVWANPSTREKLRTAETQQAEQKRKDEARAKAAAAKKASSSVTGAPGAGQSPQSGGRSDKSLREQLEEATADALSA